MPILFFSYPWDGSLNLMNTDILKPLFDVLTVHSYSSDSKIPLHLTSSKFLPTHYQKVRMRERRAPCLFSSVLGRMDSSNKLQNIFPVWISPHSTILTMNLKLKFSCMVEVLLNVHTLVTSFCSYEYYHLIYVNKSIIMSRKYTRWKNYISQKKRP